MDLKSINLYLSSTEQVNSNLPVKCQCINQPSQKSGEYTYDRGIILVRTEQCLDIYKTDTLLLVPKHEGYPISRLETDEAVFVYVLDGSSYTDVDVVDLSEKKDDILDWGAVTLSYESAVKWQVKE